MWEKRTQVARYTEINISVNSLGTSINKYADCAEVHFRGILSPSSIILRSWRIGHYKDMNSGKLCDFLQNLN